MKVRKRKSKVSTRVGANLLRADPTRSIALRRQFAGKVRVMFAKLKGAITKMVLVDDELGLKEKQHGLKLNAFCPTGEGGGIDDSCSSTHGEGSIKERYPHMAHLLNGITEVHPVGTKSAARSLADSMRAEGKHATIWRDPRGSKGSKWLVANAFCPTGEGGGVDPSCSPLSSDGNIGALIKSLPGKVYSRIKTKVQEKYASLQTRYGSTYAKAIIGAALAGLPVPLPGASMALAAPVVALAELHRLFRGGPKTNEGLDERKVKIAADELVEELRREFASDTVLNEEMVGPEVPQIGDNYPMWNSFCATGEGGGVDPSCGPGIGARQKFEYFHATSASNLKSIVKKGLLASKAGKVWSGLSTKGHVFMTLDRKEAEEWGRVAAGEGHDVVVFKLFIPESERHNLTGAGSKFSKERAFKGDIKPEWLRGYDIVRNEEPVYLGIKLDKVGELLESDPVTNAPGEARFRTSPEKVAEFQKWLKTQMSELVAGRSQEELWRAYIEQGFRKGQGRAFDDANKSEELLKRQAERLDFYAGTREQFLKSSFGRPIAKEKVELLAGRVFEELRNVTTDMATRMTRTLTDGLVQGKGPRDIARDLAADVEIGQTRALTISRTEIIRAHAEGQLQALSDLGVEEVGVAVEWSTTGDERVCEECMPLEGVVLKLDEARGMLPRHPNCRCAWIPANVGESDKNQKDTKGEIKGAIRESKEAQGQSDKKGWEWDSGQAISKNRPESILNQLAEFDRLLNGGA